MPFTDKRVPAVPKAPSRRERLMREIKLALVDQQVKVEATGCNPYDALQGQGRVDRWMPRRR
jgi:hypothetical protein